MSLVFNQNALSSLDNVDEALINKIMANNDADHWSYKDCCNRENSHIYYQYPAMMVPNLQKELIKTIVDLQQGVQYVLDPFVGSGTTMTECMFQGLNFVGQDINPLSILLCKAKMGPFQPMALGNKADQIIQTAQNDCTTEIAVDFFGLIKWFRSDVAIAISKLQKAIRKEKYSWARKFFWISLSEVIRLSSNSRTSTYKLHMRPKEEIVQRSISPIDLFRSIVNRNIREMAKQQAGLNRLTLLKKGYYEKKINIFLQDSSKKINLADEHILFDLVVTSPPYGDNKTTVPYGQNSFLPLQWVDFKDIDDEIDSSWLKSTSEIDSRSLGGSLMDIINKSKYLLEISPTLATIIKELEVQKEDRILRVLSFFMDLNNSLAKISESVKNNAYLVWTVGNRRVGKLEIKTDAILIELMKWHNIKLITGVTRDILHKRMATRNNIVSTMKKERILIFRKQPTPN